MNCMKTKELMENTSFESNAAYSFASKNPEKKRLKSLYFDQTGFAVSTDGHRIFGAKKLFESSKVGAAYDLDGIYENGQFNKIEEQYPDWHQVVPKEDYSNQFNLKIPEWFKLFQNYEEKALMTIDFSNRMFPKLVNGCLLNDKSCGINAALFSPFAGMDVKILIKDQNSAVAILPGNVEIPSDPSDLKEHLLNAEWFALIMPVRMDKIEQSSADGRETVFV
jgi:hypothetical protein